MGRSEICKSLERRNRRLQTGRVSKPDSEFVWNLHILQKRDHFFSDESKPAKIEVLDIVVKQITYYDKRFKTVFS